MNNRQICLNLMKAETEKEVIRILKNVGYWNNSNMWRCYGDIENNLGTITNQQSKPEAALVEKLVNSIDSVLIKEIKLKGIDIESDKAPQTTQEATKLVFGIKKNLVNFDKKKRGKIAENIKLITTGIKTNPNYVILDKGEGQAPNNFPTTFLSLHASNKDKIKFVQGRYNMGGSGVLPFCGKNKLQLVVSKRHPSMLEAGDDSDWGFTIVRKEAPKAGSKNSVYTYLAPNKKILTFKDKKITYEKTAITYGSLIKLYDYNIGSYKTNSKLNLYKKLSLLLPTIALPITILDNRKEFSQENNRTILNGLTVRLVEDRNSNIEKSFPCKATMNIDNNQIDIQIYVFKKDRHTNYKTTEGVLFTLNGQNQTTINHSFFNGRDVGLGYLMKSLIVEVDCSKISKQHIEDMFMASRDRTKETEFQKKIISELKKILSKHAGLKRLKNQRRYEELKNNIDNSETLTKTINQIIRKNKSMASIFKMGKRVKNPFDTRLMNAAKTFNGADSPTFFTLLTKYKNKNCELGRKFRVQYETDLKNDYKINSVDGDFKITSPSISFVDYSLNFFDGTATLNIDIPSNSIVGDVIEYVTTLTDKTTLETFTENFTVTVIDNTPNGGGGGGTRANPPSKTKGDSKKSNSRVDIPNIIQVTKAQWGDHGFNEHSALKVVNSDENDYDFFINVDNTHFLNAIRNKEDVTAEEMKNKYTMCLLIYGMSYLIDSNNNEKKYEDIYGEIEKNSKILIYGFFEMLAVAEEINVSK